MRHSFETAWGVFAVEWSEKGLTRVEFPPARKGSDEPVGAAAKAVEAVKKYVAGAAVSLEAPLDLGGASEFARRVYAELQRVPRGRTLTYGELAARAGSPGAARAVGRALASNPVPLFVPCHRVLASGGKPGGFSAPGGLSTKARLLEIERAR